MRTCKCPNCNATLTIEDENRDFAFCQYCGAKIMLDDYRSTQRIIDEAKIKQIEYDREIRLKELALQEKQNEQKQRSRKVLIDLWIIASIIVVISLTRLFNHTSYCFINIKNCSFTIIPPIPKINS